MGGTACRFPVFYLSIVNFPLYGVILCIVYAVVAKQSTATSCADNPEFLPSISMVIGTEPEKTIWQTIIGVTTPFRLAVGLLYLRYGTMRFKVVACFFFAVELVCLCVLTFVTSAENFAIHSTAFYCFAATSSVAMLLNAVSANRTPFAVWTERTALLTKRVFAFAYLMLLGIAYWLYYMHDHYCIAYSYSYFAMSEYALVITNCLYHGCAIFDFWHWYLTCRCHPLPRSPRKTISMESLTLSVTSESPDGVSDKSELV